VSSPASVIDKLKFVGNNSGFELTPNFGPNAGPNFSATTFSEQLWSGTHMQSGKSAAAMSKEAARPMALGCTPMKATSVGDFFNAPPSAGAEQKNDGGWQ